MSSITDDNEEVISALKAGLLANRAIRESILAKTGSSDLGGNNKPTAQELLLELVEHHNWQSSLEEKNVEKALMKIAIERIQKRANYNKLGRILLFFVLYVSTILLRDVSTSSFEIESRCMRNITIRFFSSGGMEDNYK
jgi:hypothetical protein